MFIQGENLMSRKLALLIVVLLFTLTTTSAEARLFLRRSSCPNAQCSSAPKITLSVPQGRPTISSRAATQRTVRRAPAGRLSGRILRLFR